MNRVFLGERCGAIPGPPVAIKLIEGSCGEQEGRLFARECEILARLEHPGITRFLDGGVSSDGTRFLVMERIEGAPLLDCCDARRLPIPKRLEIFLDICEAVGHAHANLVVHRDLKPQNVLVTDRGQAKLLDFGIGKFLGSGDLETTMLSDRFLTPAFASPEQLSGASVGTATDIYSLGLMLFELLVGRPPFSTRELIHGGAFEARRRGPGAPSSAIRSAAGNVAEDRSTSLANLARQLRGDLDTIVACCLQLEPGQRYPSVEHLADDVRRHLEGLPIRGCRPTFGYRLGKLLRRNPSSAGAGSIAVPALVALAFLLVSRHQTIVGERDRAGNPSAGRRARPGPPTGSPTAAP